MLSDESEEVQLLVAAARELWDIYKAVSILIATESAAAGQPTPLRLLRKCILEAQEGDTLNDLHTAFQELSKRVRSPAVRSAAEATLRQIRDCQARWMSSVAFNTQWAGN
jgi:hypothetical protein